jgi:phage gpG-like protein
MADDIKLVIGVDDRDLIKAQKEQLKFQRNIITIEKAFRNGDITAKRYNQELNKQTKELQRLGGSYRTASSEVRKYAYAMRQADDATLAQSQAMAFAGKKINRMGVGLQQAGYQIGDFAVQIQGGTNAMVALGQQGSQLLGIFGPYGALAGAALAIGTAFIAPFMRATKEVKAFQKAADEALKSVKDRVDELQTGRDKNVRAYDEEIARLRTLALGQLEVYNAKLDTAKAQRLSNSDAEVFSRQERENYHATLDLIRKQMKDKGEYLGYLDQERQLLKKKAQEERDALEQKRKQEELARQERLLGQQMADLERQRALAQFKKDVAAEAETLDAMFQNRTLYYSIRFSGDADVMSQSLTPSTKGVKPTQSYQELIAMGWSPEDLERIGVKAPRKSGGSKKAPKDPLVELNKRITLDEKLLGVSKERETVLRAIANSDKEYSDAAINGSISRLEAYNKEKELLEEAAAQQQNIADTLKNSMEDAFMSIVDGTKSAEDAFKDMARMIISELYKVLVVQQMVGSFEAGGGGILGSIFGAIGKKASGGTVMSNQPYLVGEKGPEVIVPQNRGHVMNADLTAKAMGGSGEAVVVNQTFNFAANGDDSVKKLIAQAAPQIANMTQKQIMDSRRRGGAMKSTFG